MKSVLCNISTGFVLAALVASAASAADWPTAGGDVRRSNVSPDVLSLPLVETWRHAPLHGPRPAWPEEPARQDVYRKVYGLSPTVTFDRAFQPVVVGGRLYYGSSADDSLSCLDADTGKLLWTFGTEGPIRLAPTVYEGKVYFGSDDGCVYCLNADQGNLVWKYRPVEPDRRLPGNGRMISLWPIRSGVLVDAGTAWFTAGLFPSQGAWLCAVEAASGKPIWKQPVDVSPQGYMLASTNRLFVPTGRAAPHIYLRDGGEQVAPFTGSGEQRAGFPDGGGAYALVLDDVLVHSGGEKRGLQFTAAGTREKILTAPGIRLVARGDTAYLLDMDRLQAIHRARYVELIRLEAKKEKSAGDRQRIARLRSPEEPAVLWDVPCASPYAMVLTGDTLFCGGDGSVVAFDAKSGKQTWQAPVDGKAYALALAEKRLYAGTDHGTLYCFGNEVAAPAPPTEVASLQTPDSAQRSLAQGALQACGTDLGYCLALGSASVPLAQAVLQSSRMNVVCALDKEDQAAEYRRAHALSPTPAGNRITYHATSLAGLPYQGKVFNLILAVLPPGSQQPPTPAAEILRLLRPCGGTLVLVAQDADRPVETRAGLETWAQGAIPGLVFAENSSQIVATATRGPLEGAGQWTHFYADPGNSACSGDSVQFGPVDVQWFGRPGPSRMV
ncbi:MAG: outer membrane protein assembly factor BamB family protein, partial [Thermoguttaceae bacterium]